MEKSSQSQKFEKFCLDTGVDDTSGKFTASVVDTGGEP
jgi:hypothetical protein